MDIRKTEAVTINQTDYRETSQIVTFFTRDYGRIRTVAKGAKRPKNNFEGPFDLLSYTKIVFIDKPTSGMGILTDCKIQDKFLPLRKSLHRIYQGFYIADFLNELTPEGEKNNLLFDLALRTLQNIARNGNFKMLLSFEAQAIKYLGYMPHTKYCASCEKKVMPDDRKRVVFSAKHGGVLCAHCQKIDPYRITTNLGVLSLFYNLANNITSGLSRLKITETMVQELQQLLKYYIDSMAGKNLKTAQLVEMGNTFPRYDRGNAHKEIVPNVPNEEIRVASSSRHSAG